MQELDIPIFKQAYELYRTFHGYRGGVAKQDRYTLWLRTENLILEVLEGILIAGQLSKGQKLQPLENVSVKLNLLRVFLRLAKDTKSLDLKKYTNLEMIVDEMGKMLGGWIKSVKGHPSKEPSLIENF